MKLKRKTNSKTIVNKNIKKIRTVSDIKKKLEDAIENKTRFKKWIKIKQIEIKNKGQNQKKNNLKGLYESVEG